MASGPQERRWGWKVGLSMTGLGNDSCDSRSWSEGHQDFIRLIRR